MNALVSAPPEAAIAAARRGIAQLRAAGGSGHRLAAVNGEALHLSAPHRVYHLGRDDAARGNTTPHARPVGWRFILTDDTDALAAVEVREREDAGYEFSGVNYGPFVHSTVEAVKRLECAADSNDELRLLDVPALYLEALWLHGDADRFMPLSPAPDGLEAYRVYPDSEFAEAVAKLASARREGPALAP
jgi:hypothetical protein